MKRLIILLVLVVITMIVPIKFVRASGLTQATGDDFTIAIYNDIHADNGCPSVDNCSPTDVSQAWVDSVDWLVGANGHGPGGMSALSYWNIKAIGAIGDYVTTCNTNNWAVFATQYARIAALGLPGIWTQGNHDFCSQYTSTFGSTNQSATVDVSTSLGTIKIGLVGVGVADDMSSGTSRTFVDAAIAASQANRQWIFLRHVGTYEGLPGGAVNSYPANGDSGWCYDYTSCAGYVGTQTGISLRDNFYQHESKVYWGVHGHNGGLSINSLVADDGHTVNVTGHLGASGGIPGYITLLKFRPSHNDIQMALYRANMGLTGAINKYDNGTDMGPYTWAWTPNPTTSNKLFPLPSPVSH